MTELTALNILHRFCGTLCTVAMLAQWNRLGS